jgi:shikimate dehydrogenase
LIYALVGAGAEVIICSRRAEKGQRLAAEFGAAGALDYAALDTFACEILINTTPVGMFPRVDALPVPESFLKPGMVVMDIVYNPLETRLLRVAAAHGANIVDGLGMFVGQGALQFALMTGSSAPTKVMREAVLRILAREGEK